MPASYDSAVEEAKKLRSDSQKAARRDNWEQVIQRFAAIEKKEGKGEIAAKSAYQQGALWEELGNISRNANDWRKAATVFIRIADAYPRQSVAPDALLRCASIQAKQLGNPAAGRAALDRLIAGYPKSKEYRAAVALRNSMATVPSRHDPPAVVKQQDTGGLLQGIAWQGIGKTGTLTLDISKETRFRHQYLAPAGKEPARLQIDLESTLPDNSIQQEQTLSGGPATKIRVIGLGGESVRVLVDLKTITHYRVSASARPARILVQAGSGKAPAGAHAISPGSRKNGAAHEGAFDGLAEKRPGTLVEQLGLTVRAVMIDPGHGGNDPGATGNSIRESLVTLRMAKMLGKMLTRQGFEVLYTRDGDTSLALDLRPLIANKRKADIFISLHVNANSDPEINGVETYFLDLARTGSAAAVAARENAVSVQSISDLQVILADLMLSAKMQESRELAALVHSRSVKHLQQAGFLPHDNGVRSAPFAVLMGARMPAVLVEVGYLTNKVDAANLMTDKYLERFAEGICAGVLAYKKKISRFAR